MAAELRCEVCAGLVGEHFGDCPAGAGALFEGIDTYSGELGALAQVPREVLRLDLVDLAGDEPELPMT